MSNIISFLESMGQDARLAKLVGEEYTASVDALGLDDAPRNALLARDHESLNDLLGGRSKVLCSLMPADDDDQSKDDVPDDQDDPVPDEQQKQSIGRH